MPLNHELLLRRRRLLGFSQMSLSIVAGLSEQTVGRLERGQAPNEGGNISIDTASRICAALQIELHELILPPVGNMYEAAVRFAHREHSPRQAPHLHDRGRSIQAQGLRKLTGELTLADQAVLARASAEDDVILTTDEGEQVAASEVLRAQAYRHQREYPEAYEHPEDSQEPTPADYIELAEEAAATGTSDWNFADKSTE